SKLLSRNALAMGRERQCASAMLAANSLHGSDRLERRPMCSLQREGLMQAFIANDPLRKGRSDGAKRFLDVGRGARRLQAGDQLARSVGFGGFARIGVRFSLGGTGL